MPMNPEMVLGILGNLLAMPKTWEDARNQQILNNQMSTLIGDASGKPITPPEPMGHFPGYDVPVLGSIERGIGTVGQIMGTALGHPPSAPRIDPSMLGMLLAQQRAGDARTDRNVHFDQQEKDRQVRIEEMQSNDKFRQDEAKARDAERAENTTFQHGMLTSMDEERKERLKQQAEGKQPNDPALRKFLQEKPNATADEIRAYELSLKPGAAAAGQNPAQRGALTPFKAFAMEHPDSKSITEDWEDYQALQAAKKTAAVQGAKPLPAPVQQTVSSMETIRTGMARLKEMLLNDPDVAAGRGIVEGRVEQYLYNTGLAQKGQDPYLALQNMLKVVGAQPWMRNVRRYDMILDIRQHLPKAGDTKDLILSKIDNLDMFGIETEAQALKFAGTNIGSIPGLEQGLQGESQQKGYNLPESSFQVPGAAPVDPGKATQPAAPGAPPTPGSDDWHKMLDQFGVPR
jgi:hypothetical protein